VPPASRTGIRDHALAKADATYAAGAHEAASSHAPNSTPP
jgi:hypothetical protein